MVTKVKSGVIGDNTVGITQLNVSDGSNGQALTTNGSGTLSFASVGVSGISSSADATAITITSDEKVGIGATSPTVLLDVYNGSGWGGIDVDGTSGGEIRFQKAGTNYGNIYANDSSGFIINAQNGLADIFFQSGGTTKMAMLDSGNVGIGSTSPDGKVDIAQAQNTTAASFTTPHLALTATGTTDTTGFTGISYASSVLTNYGWTVGAQRTSTSGGTTAFITRYHSNSAAGTEYMRLTQSGRLGIGTSSPAGKFQVEGSHSGQIGYFNQTGSGGGNHGVYIDSASTSGWTLLVRNGGNAKFGLTGNEFRWFNGVVAQAGTSTSDKGSGIRNWAGSGYIGLSGDLTGYAAGSYSTLKANGSYIYFDIGGSYSAYMASNGTINANSDRRLKENIETLSTGQLDKVCNLRGVNFDWIDQRVTGNQVGLIAQEVQEEYPELVGDGGVEDGTLTVNYAGLVSPLIEAIKELKTELDAAKARITTLEG